MVLSNKVKQATILATGRGVSSRGSAFGANAHINIFYLRDKILEHRVLHERFEALAVLQKQRSHSSFDQMLRQMIDRLPLVIDGDPHYFPVIDEIVKLIQSYGNLSIVDHAITKLKSCRITSLDSQPIQ